MSHLVLDTVCVGISAVSCSAALTFAFLTWRELRRLRKRADDAVRDLQNLHVA